MRTFALDYVQKKNNVSLKKEDKEEKQISNITS
jgi:hypothetical protein